MTEAATANAVGAPIISQLDIAPTIAFILGLTLPCSDGKPISPVLAWGCKNVALIIIDSLGYDLFQWLLPALNNMNALCHDGLLIRAHSVSNHTTPAIASILSGLLPEHHGIFDKAGAKESKIFSLPELASSSGHSSAVIMEQNGADVYRGLVEMVHGISDKVSPQDFDEEACRMTCGALKEQPRLLVSYFIGIDKCVHMGAGPAGIREAALIIDRCIGKVVRKVDEDTLFIICGDHPIHAGPLRRRDGPYFVAMIMGRGMAARK